MILPGSLKNVVREKSGSPVYVSGPGLFIFFMVLAAGAVGAVLLYHPAPVFTALVMGIYFLFAVEVAKQWERAAVLRLPSFPATPGGSPYP